VLSRQPFGPLLSQMNIRGQAWHFAIPPNQGLLVSWALSWVPAEFIGVVERGLEVECMGMICWADT
jgi:hypothetical protein